MGHRVCQTQSRTSDGRTVCSRVFEKETGKVLVIGVNRVVPSNISSAHAEIVALSIAQQLQLQNWDLGGAAMPHLQLVVNWRPCAMCFGAVIWSGIRSLVIAGSDDSVERITVFDEGPIHPQWRQHLQDRGIELCDGSALLRGHQRLRTVSRRGAIGLQRTARQLDNLANKSTWLLRYRLSTLLDSVLDVAK